MLMSLIKVNPKGLFRMFGAVRSRGRALGVLRDERGLSTVEYVILLALIAVVAIGTWGTFGEQVHEAISNSSSAFEDVVDASDAANSPSP
jgi:Flp pilus assembly pilin Flp